MGRDEALRRLTGSRSARLATVRPDSTPHVVPIVFAVIGGDIVTMIDHKPKTTQNLQRLRNLEANPRASVLVDHYGEDWEQLWWVRVDGDARVIGDGPEHERAAAALAGKYGQYLDRPPTGPAIIIPMGHVSWWVSSV